MLPDIYVETLFHW